MAKNKPNSAPALTEPDFSQYNKFKDPMLGMMYSFGAPVFDVNVFGDKQFHTINENTPPTPPPPPPPPQPEDPTGGNPNPFAKYGLPRWYYNWMMSQGIAGGRPQRRPDEEDDAAVQQKGLLG